MVLDTTNKSTIPTSDPTSHRLFLTPLPNQVLAAEEERLEPDASLPTKSEQTLRPKLHEASQRSL